jgi:hypothetical protein
MRMVFVWLFRATHIVLANGEKKILDRYDVVKRKAAAKQLLVPFMLSDSSVLNIKVSFCYHIISSVFVHCVVTINLTDIINSCQRFYAADRVTEVVRVTQYKNTHFVVGSRMEYKTKML